MGDGGNRKYKKIKKSKLLKDIKNLNLTTHFFYLRLLKRQLNGSLFTMKKYICIFTIFLSCYIFGQNQQNPELLFQEARRIAFEEKNYANSIDFARKALELDPEQTEIQIFLGRLYAWNKDYASSERVYLDLEQKGIKELDFFVAYSTILFWQEKNEEALNVLENGLLQHPSSAELLLLKAKVLMNKKDYSASETSLEQLLLLQPNNAEARALLTNIQNSNSKNEISVAYLFNHFDRQFDEDWHNISVGYKRNFKTVPILAKINFANRFGEGGTQYEVEGYPRISKTFYMYLGASYSNDLVVFPKYKTSLSLFANLPKNFEAEIGFRQLYFNRSIWMYTASIGKYYQQFWFNLRAFLTPEKQKTAHSYTGTARYYIKGINDYLDFQIGSGISPDESNNQLLENISFKSKTFRVGASYHFSVKKSNLFSVSGAYYNQEYLPKTKENQMEFGLRYAKIF